MGILRKWFGYDDGDDLPRERECEPRPTPPERLETHRSVAVERCAAAGCGRCQRRVAELRARD